MPDGTNVTGTDVTCADYDGASTCTCSAGEIKTRAGNPSINGCGPDLANVMGDTVLTPAQVGCCNANAPSSKAGPF